MYELLWGTKTHKTRVSKPSKTLCANANTYLANFYHNAHISVADGEGSWNLPIWVCLSKYHVVKRRLMESKHFKSQCVGGVGAIWITNWTGIDHKHKYEYVMISLSLFHFNAHYFHIYKAISNHCYFAKTNWFSIMACNQWTRQKPLNNRK